MQKEDKKNTSENINLIDSHDLLNQNMKLSNIALTIIQILMQIINTNTKISKLYHFQLQECSERYF